MSSQKNNMWLWTDPDSRWKSKVLNHMRKTILTNKDIIFLHCKSFVSFDESIPLTNFIFNLCYKFNVFKGEKLMFLNPKDLLQAIELCMRKSIKEVAEENSDISDKDIICGHQHYASHFDNKEISTKSVEELTGFIKQNNCIDLFAILDALNEFKSENSEFLNFLSSCEFLILGHPSSNVLIKLLKLLSTSDQVSNINVATPLNISLQGSPTSPLDSIEISVSSLSMDEIPFHVETEANIGSATEEYVLDIILSFLSLLVNSRNELSLSKVMVSPFIDLTHEAFTNLKHLAAEKDMPMCQTAVSYVTRVRLGGKGYAPQADCPMMSHLKSLELFVDTLNQLQTLIEEETKPITALKRLINILKKKLVKCGSEKLKPTAIESACEQLKSYVDKAASLSKTQMYTSNSPQVNQASFDLLRFFINYINCDVNTFDPEQILQRKKVKRTPINLPPLLGYFRSPDEESTCDSLPMADEDSVISTNSSIKNAAVSYFHYSDNSSVSQSCVEPSSPVKISFEGCLADHENIDKKRKQIETPKHPKKKSKGLKRSILGEITNENSNSEIRNKKLKILNFKSDQITNENSNSEIRNKKLKILNFKSDQITNENSNSEIKNKKLKILNFKSDQITNENSNSKNEEKKFNDLNFKLDEITNEDSNSDNKEKQVVLNFSDEFTNENSNSQNKNKFPNSVSANLVSKTQTKAKREPKKKDIKKEPKSKTKASKVFKQIEGQGKITNFFTMK